MATDPLYGIPPALHAEIRQIWGAEVAGGRALYERTGSTVGRAGCRKVSRLLRSHGVVPGTDQRWERVRDHGRELYFGRIKP